MKLLVGLGNPGTRYAGTRHNVGYFVLDAWLVTHERPQRLVPGKALEDAGRNVVAFRPSTAMNVSGDSVRRELDRRGLTAHDALVLCDDLNLPLGQLRLRGEGSSGGHHGLESLIVALGTTAFARLRVGIGAVPPGMEGAEFVLSDFTATERPIIDAACATAAQAIDIWLEEGLDAAMQQCNRRNPESP